MAREERKIVIDGVEYSGTVERIPAEDPEEGLTRRPRTRTINNGYSRAFNPGLLGHRPKLDFEHMDEDKYD